MTPTFWRGPRCQLTPAPASSFSSPADFLDNIRVSFQPDTDLLNASGSPASDGEALSEWGDQSANGIDLVQATASKQPIYKTNRLNGYGSVYMNSTAHYLAITGQTVCSLPYAVYWVGRRADPGDDLGNRLWDMWFTGQGIQATNQGFHVSGNYAISGESGTDAWGAGLVDTDAHWFVLGSGESLYYDGADKSSEISLDAINTYDPDQLYLGSFSTATTTAGNEVFEFVIDEALPTAAKVSNWQTYVGNKYGL